MMYTQNTFLFCGITKNHYTKEVPSKVYSVRCVGCVECEGVTVCTVTGVAKHQLTCRWSLSTVVNMPIVREELNGRPVAMRLCAPPR